MRLLYIALWRISPRNNKNHREIQKKAQRNNKNHGEIQKNIQENQRKSLSNPKTFTEKSKKFHREIPQKKITKNCAL